MNKNLVKISSILMIIAVLLTFMTPVFAAWGGMDPTGISAEDSAGQASVKSVAGKIIGFIRNIAVAAAVIIIMVLGVKYMLGSVEQKAEYKKSMIPLIVGILLVAAASQLAKMLFNMFSGVSV